MVGKGGTSKAMREKEKQKGKAKVMKGKKTKKHRGPAVVIQIPVRCQKEGGFSVIQQGK